MGDTGEGVALPANMSEEQVLKIVRDLLGDEDMTDADLLQAYRSGMFHELCPDIAQYAQQNLESTVLVDMGQEGQSSSSIKKELPETHQSSYSSMFEPVVTKTKIVKKEKTSAASDSEESSRHSSHHKKKKKKKHKHKESRKDREKEKSQQHPQKSPKYKIQQITLTSDSEDEVKVEKPKKEKKAKVACISSSSSESDMFIKISNPKVKPSSHNPPVVVKNTHIINVVHIKKTDDTEKAKHNVVKSEPEPRVKTDNHSSSKDIKRQETTEKEKERNLPKPFSKYRSSASHIFINRWRPVLDREHLRYQKKFRLKPVSVVCLDLLDLPIVFHDPGKKSKNPNSVSVPLTTGETVIMESGRRNMIRRLERDKVDWFKKELLRQAHKSYKRSKHHFSDDDRKHKRVRIMMDSSSSSNGSGIRVPNKKSKLENIGKDSRGAKLSKAEKEEEDKKRRIERIKKKAAEVSINKSRKENKEASHRIDKKPIITLSDKSKKEKDKALAEKRKFMEKSRLEKLKHQKNAPSVSFQKILAQIDAANKEEARKPKVELKIPKLSQKSNRPPTEFKIEGRISVGDVAKEVSRLLSSDVKVEAPVIPDHSEDLGEYTVKKIAWWILKNEKDPPREGIFHPELHDESDCDSVHSDDFHWDSDMSSIHGCVSDPEGLASEITPSPSKINDPDWADDYCGLASLYGRMRRTDSGVTTNLNNLDSIEPFRSFLRIKPGTNYEKPNFEVKCFICDEVLKGQRQLGAHIRSDSHRNKFRNYSLAMASYEEQVVNPVRKKEFIAKLVQYSANLNLSGPSAMPEKEKHKENEGHHVGKIEHIRSDSPGPIVGGDATGNVDIHEMPIPDDISLPSIEDYDISSDESLQQVRVAIRTAGKWDADLERRWRTWQDEETKIAYVYNEERELYINEPERHPSYQKEWLEFWDRRCTELEAAGQDVDNHNFQKEWMPVWLKRIQEIMKESVEVKVNNLKRSLTIDKHTLRKIYGISAEATKRQKEKKKVGKIDNSSSIKSPSKVASSGPDLASKNLPTPSQNHRQEQHNNKQQPDRRPFDPTFHKKHKPEPFRDRDKGSHNRHDHRKYYKHGESNSNFKEKSPKHSKKIKKTNESEKTSKTNNNLDSSKGGDKNNSKKCDNKSICSNISSASSANPRPPGVEPSFRPKSSDFPFKQGLSQNFKEKREFKKKQNQKHHDDNRWKNPHNSKSEKHEKHYRDEVAKTDDCKNSKDLKSAWSESDDTNSNEQGKARDSDNNSSTSGNARALQSSLKALREAMAKEETLGTKNESTIRPKIKPVEKEKAKNLEDGEVASDVSSTFFAPADPHKVSTFVNTVVVPPKGNQDNDISVSTDKLDKNSLGYHLLERRKSIEQPNNSNSRERTDRREDGQHHGSSHGRVDHNKRKEDHHKGGKDHNRGSRDEHHKKSHKGKDWKRRNSHDNRHRPNNQNFNNPSVFNSNSNSTSTSAFHEETWEPEPAQAHSPAGLSPWSQYPATENPPPIPGNHIPVVTARREAPPLNFHPNYQQTNPWDNQYQTGWNDNNWGNYPPQMSNPNNYYKQ